MAERIPPPFFVGGPIPTALSERHFHGYEEARRDLDQMLNRRAAGRVALKGAPQSGKTSLVLSVPPPAEGTRTILDLAKIWPSTPRRTYALLMEALGSAKRGASPPQGEPEEALSTLPAPRRGTRGVLVLENVEALDEIDRRLRPALGRLLERIPHHAIITGMDPPLAQADLNVELQPFSEASCADFLRRRLSHGGLRLEPDAAAAYHEFTQGRPDLMQRLGLLVWDQASQAGRGRVEPGDIDAAVGEIVDRLPTQTVAAWAAVRGLMRDVFVAMCLYDLTSPTDIARRLDHEPKNVIVLLARLMQQHGLVERVGRGTYRVRDPLLKHRVRRDWGTPILR